MHALVRRRVRLWLVASDGRNALREELIDNLINGRYCS